MTVSWFGFMQTDVSYEIETGGEDVVTVEVDAATAEADVPQDNGEVPVVGLWQLFLICCISPVGMPNYPVA